MSKPYLKPLQPPGCTLTRRPPLSTGTPSASMNRSTSVDATGVTTIARVGSCTVLIPNLLTVKARLGDDSSPSRVRPKYSPDQIGLQPAYCCRHNPLTNARVPGAQSAGTALAVSGTA